SLSVDKTVQGSDAATLWSGYVFRSATVRAAYNADGPPLEKLVVTDPYLGNEDFFDHVDFSQLLPEFTPGLVQDSRDYQLYYTTNQDSSWRLYQPDTPLNTATPTQINI